MVIQLKKWTIILIQLCWKEEKGETLFNAIEWIGNSIRKMKVFRLMKVAIVTLTNIYVNMQLLDM